MRHLASSRFWKNYDVLLPEIQALANKNFELLKTDFAHPSLRFKKVGRYWSVRVGLTHRALAVEDGEDLLWFWIGPHDEYGRLVRG
jgi:hypothetical protein